MSTFHFEAPDGGGGSRDEPGEASYRPVTTNDVEVDSVIENEDEDDFNDLLEPFPERGGAESGFASTDNSGGSVGFERNTNNREDEEEDDILRPGDHVFVWCRSFGIPRAYQKHGIVLSVDRDDPSDTTIVSFYHKDGRDRQASDARGEDESEEWNDESLLNQGSTSRRQSQTITSGVRAESLLTFSKGTKIRKVKYGKNMAKRLLSRPGTVTSCAPDERGLVIARVRYMLDNPHCMPEYHMVAANGECAAVWCRIGRWCTLQGSSILHIMFIGQAGSAVAGGVVASNMCFWAPMPGFWGSVGYWWYVPATVAYPILVPVLIGFGMVSLVPLEVLRRYRKKWQQLSVKLNTDFWTTTDEEVKELYFASSMCTDDDWMNRFFMEDKEKEDEAKGKYMPLNANGGPDGVDDDDDDAMKERVAEAYRMAGEDEEGEAGEEVNKSFRQHWQGMVQKVGNSFTNRGGSSKKIRAVADDQDGDAGWDNSQLLQQDAPNKENTKNGWGMPWTKKDNEIHQSKTEKKQEEEREAVHATNLLD
eukprot:CAMPEP_0195293826 /NCGR_PEP_ID=MMETSP0707-20130614/13454_1 /TAXON_ID=33640 /ORGANISM="Asterionellopsis glacialis, Strain CCMP134" /LENGTH=533 /DNA_ID=CAMNT_0040354631 /DNA_START=20 /DNA_END=1621 /DNA_ORIENTATION=-